MPVAPPAVVTAPAAVVAAATGMTVPAEARPEAPEPPQAVPLVAQEEPEGAQLQVQLRAKGRVQGPAMTAVPVELPVTVSMQPPAAPRVPEAAPPKPASMEAAAPPEVPAGLPVQAEGPELTGAQDPEDRPPVGADRLPKPEVPVPDPAAAARPPQTTQVVAEDAEEVPGEAPEPPPLAVGESEAPEGSTREQLLHHETVPVGGRPPERGSVGARLGRGGAGSQKEPRQDGEEERGDPRGTPRRVSHGHVPSPVGGPWRAGIRLPACLEPPQAAGVPAGRRRSGPRTASASDPVELRRQGA